MHRAWSSANRCLPVYTGSYSVPSLLVHSVLIPFASVIVGPRKRSTRTIRDVSEREMVGHVGVSVEFVSEITNASDDRTGPPSLTTVGNPRESPSLACITRSRSAVTTHRHTLAPARQHRTPGTPGTITTPFRSVIPRDPVDDHRGTQRSQTPL